ncbi:hypothetical protein FRC16_011460 [Serendipita sp. 398]|nr:hypothetical protein FRC16_011460 [Serendipita sp. 398]
MSQYQNNQQPRNPDTRPLPDGWVTQYDPNYQAWFYINTREQPPRASWVHPLGAPVSPQPQQQQFSPPSGGSGGYAQPNREGGSANDYYQASPSPYPQQQQYTQQQSSPYPQQQSSPYPQQQASPYPQQQGYGSPYPQGAQGAYGNPYGYNQQQQQQGHGSAQQGHQDKSPLGALAGGGLAGGKNLSFPNINRLVY